MRRIAVILILGALVIGGARAWVWWHEDEAPFRLATPTPTTIATLGRVERPPTHPCNLGECFDYVGGWCQAPCDTYRVRATLDSVERPTRPPFYGWVIVLRDGDASIAGRVMHKPRMHVGDRVRVSGVLFFPTPRGRDGGHSANGAELSPVLDLRHS